MSNREPQFSIGSTPRQAQEALEFIVRPRGLWQRRGKPTPTGVTVSGTLDFGDRAIATGIPEDEARERLAKIKGRSSPSPDDAA